MSYEFSENPLDETATQLLAVLKTCVALAIKPPHKGTIIVNEGYLSFGMCEDILSCLCSAAIQIFFP